MIKSIETKGIFTTGGNLEKQMELQRVRVNILGNTLDISYTDIHKHLGLLISIDDILPFINDNLLLDIIERNNWHCVTSWYYQGFYISLIPLNVLQSILEGFKPNTFTFLNHLVNEVDRYLMEGEKMDSFKPTSYKQMQREEFKSYKDLYNKSRRPIQTKIEPKEIIVGNKDQQLIKQIEKVQKELDVLKLYFKNLNKK